QSEGRDLDLKVRSALAHHLIGASEHAHRRLEWPARCVLKRLARSQHGLLTDDPRPFDFFRPAGRIGRDPMPAEKLNRLVAFVGDADRVIEAPGALKGWGMLGGGV